MNAHETQEGVMDSLMEALQTGSAFSRPDQRRKRQTRVAGGKFPRTAYFDGSMTRKNQATRPYIFNNILNKSVKLMREYENATPNEIARCNVLSNRIMAELHAAADTTRFYTPEENQELYKQILIDEAKRTPKQIRHQSRVTFFQKKKQCCRCSRAYYAMQVSDETPKRDVLLNVFGKLESRCINGNWTDSNSLIEDVSINLARIVSPVKQRRVVVNKIQKRNNIVYRTILNRKRLHARRRKLYSHFQSPPDMSITMPSVVDSCSVLDANPMTIRMSTSSDGLYAKTLKMSSTPTKLLRSKNFENLTGLRDENNNIRDLRNDSFCSNVSIQLSSTEQIVKAQGSSLLTEMSGITLLSDSSPFHVINSSFVHANKKDSDTSEETSEKLTNSSVFFGNKFSALQTSGLIARHNYKLKKLKHKMWKKKWKFWQTINSV